MSKAPTPMFRKIARPSLAAMAFAAAVGALTVVPASAACPTQPSGRSFAVPAGLQGFGRVQGFEPLPLGPGEYVITIDDGPNPKTTPALLETLRSACAKATFFLIGRNAEAHPDLVRRILAEGHAVGSHSYSHPDFSKLDAKAMEEEMVRGARAVGEAAKGADGSGPIPLVRFPGSAGFPPVVPNYLVQFAARQGFVVAGIDFSPQDWRNSPPEESFKRLFDSLGKSGVILLHDGQSNTIALLPMVLAELEKRGGRIVSLTY